MLKQSLRILLLSLALSTSWAMAQPEPSMADVYAAAQAGQVDKAQTMIQQVLVSHPNSAKANYVRAELFAREGKLKLAQESLQEAERLSPGLHFAKPEAVSALKSQLGELAAHSGSARSAASAVPSASAPASTNSNNNTVMWLVLAGGVVLLVVLAVRSRQQAAGAGYPTAAPAGPYGPVGPAGPGGNGLSGPQTFGHPAGAAYPAQTAEPSMGSRIMGGVATGLAVGAGVMAAEAIGRRLMDHDEPGARGHDASGAGYSGGQQFTPMDTNTNADMGGSNFGVSDGGWDDAGGGDSGGSSDWDN
jgi:hypothetical protein